MNLRTKVLSVAGTILAAGALTLSPLAASADVDAVVFAGATGTITTVPLIGPSNPDPGSYTFGSAICAGASVDTAPAGAQAGTCVIASSGTFHNIVCGTGSAAGTATVSAGGLLPSAEQTETITYSITFVAGVGLLTGSSSDGDTTAGVVSIIPTGGNCVQGVTQFTASGAVLAA